MHLELAAMNNHHRFHTLESFFASVQKSGYKAVELWTGPMHFYMDYAQNDPVERLKRLEDAYGVKVIGICPEQTNPKPHNMATADPALAERVQAYFDRAVDVACEVGANQVVVTSGWAFLDESADEAWERSVAMLRRVARYAGERGMTLAIEALQKRESVLVNTVDDLKRLIDSVDEDALKVCLDTGATARANDTIKGYFDVFGSRVAHCHFVDVDETATHLAWGDGTRDMAQDLADLAACGYEGVLSVESASARYLADPAAADRQSIEQFNKSIQEESL